MPARRMSPRLTVSVVYVIAMFMAIMDTTIVNVALPTISRDLPGFALAGATARVL
jgi:MFS family permease